MRSFTQDLVARTARLFATPQPELWTVSVAGRPIGLLACEAGGARLSWFEAADPRLRSYAGPLPGGSTGGGSTGGRSRGGGSRDAELEALAAALSLRLGRQVELDSLPV